MSAKQDIESLKVYLDSICHNIAILQELLAEAKTNEFEDGFNACVDLSVALQMALHFMRRERERISRAINRLSREEEKKTCGKL